ncbi:MAG: flagellar biosynthetic protein FliR [Desulfarculales bacterium]|jgi:flagellar biosynthetic protein FliR|nr:flagellar biosynthetic protein FliR [Desulfarculales bacterium]
MELISDYTFNQWAIFLLILLRTGALFITIPFFSSSNIPAMVKIGLCLALSFMLQPLLDISADAYPREIIGFSLLAAGELMIGVIMGLCVRILIASVQIMGQLAGFQMGFAVANVIDPIGGEQVSILAQFCYLMAFLLFLILDGHMLIIGALKESFVYVPPGTFGISSSLFETVMEQAGSMFTLALRIGAPLIGALLFTQVAMGVVAKTVPQMNILIVGFPVTISVGMIFLALIMATMVSILSGRFLGLGELMRQLLRGM